MTRHPGNIRLGRTVPLLAGALIAAIFVSTGCGSSESDSGRVTVSATTGILADITEQVAGPDADVIQVIPDSSSPHEFALSAQDRAKVEDSALLVNNGASLEAGIPIEEMDVPQWALADHAGELLAFGEDEHADEHADEHEAGDEEEHEHEHGSSDPHIWMDPSRVAAALPSLADALAEADPGHAAGYRKRAAAYAEQLRAVDADVERSIAELPPSERKLVTSHDALGYFADRYGMEVVATPFPASGPEAEASAADIENVESVIRETGVPAVFAEETDDPEVLQQIADRTGVVVVSDLLVEAPGPAGSYAEMLRRDAALISGALAANPRPSG